MISPNFSDKRTAEKYSSAFTLSDMEIFIFPDLFFPLVLSNIMSPALWKWREDLWFVNIHKRSFNYRVNRIKQYIIDNYVFNLDLATWGLTSRTRETERFSEFFNAELLKQSNALFGYEGDKYYFSMDIRRHFGLDRFDDDVIPYWKTETIEAMDAFSNKPIYNSGAGECVSLAALYAAALFVVGRIEIDDIFIMATPLHSQNFITVKEGIITNNRRIVTKNMWFNGTSMSARARRAIENEKITIVSHITGHIHAIYDKATISETAYNKFSAKLNKFLEAPLDKQLFINFLRFKQYKSLFQYRDDQGGKPRYIALEKLFEYEHGSRFNVAQESRTNLLNEMDGDEFSLSPVSKRILLNDFELILDECNGKDNSCILKLIKESIPDLLEIIPEELFSDLNAFLKVEPRLPGNDKDFEPEISPRISVEKSREEIIEEITLSSRVSEMSLLALYVYRMMDKIDWNPFIKAAIERNPVAFSDFAGKDIREVYTLINSLTNHSIYPEQRLAQPDEVWNFLSGDGIEKAMLMAAWVNYSSQNSITEIDINYDKVTVKNREEIFNFRSEKGLRKKIIIGPEKERYHIIESC